MNPSVQISVKVPLEDYLKLEKILVERGKRLSAVIRGLIFDYVDNYDFKKVESK